MEGGGGASVATLVRGREGVAVKKPVKIGGPGTYLWSVTFQWMPNLPSPALKWSPHSGTVKVERCSRWNLEPAVLGRAVSRNVRKVTRHGPKRAAIAVALATEPH